MLVGVGIAEMEALPAEREECFSAFVALQRDRARRLAWRLVGGDEAVAEDVTQEAFVRAYQALDRFRGEASLETWFYRILVRQAQNYRRWRAVRTLWQPESEAEPADPTPVAQGDPGLRRRIAQAWTTSRVGSAKPSCWSILRDLRCRSVPIFWGNRAGPLRVISTALWSNCARNWPT